MVIDFHKNGFLLKEMNKFTLVEFYEREINNIYEFEIYENNCEYLGLLYFINECSDVDSYLDGDGPLSKEAEETEESDKIPREIFEEDVNWMKWYLDKCYIEYLDNVPNYISKKLDKYQIVGYYKWHSQILDYDKIDGILLIGHHDSLC